MTKKRFIYFGLLLIIIFLVSTMYFSYAFFTNKTEGSGKLNIVAGTLDYKIESSDLENNQITVLANSMKKVSLNLKSLNGISSKYGLYYQAENLDNLIIGYGDINNQISGVIEANENKKIEIFIRNTSSENKTLTFGIGGSLLNDEIDFESNDKVDYENLCTKNTEYRFEYIQNSENFITPCNGNYKIELWGAQGGSMSGTAYNRYNSVRIPSIEYVGGEGAYTKGNIILNENQNLYIYVGSTPNPLSSIGGYNGGASIKPGEEAYGTPGGGATDIRLISGSWDEFNSLKTRIMVAAGGGGANFRNQGYGEGDGGEGGTLNGINGYEALTPDSYFRDDYPLGYIIGQGATQTSGGNTVVHSTDGTIYEDVANGKFGGANLDTNDPIYSLNSAIRPQTGGGGGYYSGGSSLHAGAGGGSSFISGYQGCDAITETSVLENIVHTGQSNHYSGFVFEDSLMIAGNSNMPTHDGTSTMTGNSGNGYAKITYLGD